MSNWFAAEKKQTPIGFYERLKHIAKYYWRGILGFVLGVAFVPQLDNEPGTPFKQARNLYLMIIFYMIFQPIPPPISACLPVILAPLCNILSSKRLTSMFFDDNIAQFILGSMILLLLNNSGFDRRVLLKFMCLGEEMKPLKFLFTTSVGVFIMSMFSNRLIVMNTVMEVLTKPLQDAIDSVPANKSGPNYKLFKNMVICCLSSVCSIGSFGTIHSSTTVMMFKATWHGGWAKMEFPDIFNYFQYMFFAIPLSIVCMLATVGLYCLLYLYKFKSDPIPAATLKSIREVCMAQKNKLPEVSGHEMQSVFFTIFYFIMLLFRYSYMLGCGWASYRHIPSAETLPYIRDCTVSAGFVILLCILPKDVKFVKIFTAETKNDLPPAKRPSGIIFWPFIDKNVNYGYILLMGGAVSLEAVFEATRYNAELGTFYSNFINSLGYDVTLLIFLLLGAIFANLTIGAGAVMIIMPLVKSMGAVIHNHPWPSQHYIGALGLGIACSFGFMSSFRYTPNYYAKTVGNTKTIDMIKLGIVPMIVNVIILWFFLMYFAPTVFDPKDQGVHAEWSGGVLVPADTTLAPAASLKMNHKGDIG